MTGRERLLAAINNEKPDHLPCQVHSWMQYYLNTYLNGMDQFDAYRYFDMDPVIYYSGNYLFKPEDLQKWDYKHVETAPDAEGAFDWVNTITTPKGTLTYKGATNKFTFWETEHMIKDEKDFELFKEFFPVPYDCDWSKVIEAKKRIGDTGIVRGISYAYGQVAPWQTLCYLMGTEKTIYKAFDDPDWVHYALNAINEKFIRGVEVSGKIELDLVEIGGGAGSSTVISPTMHKEFCLPYDKKLVEAIHAHGSKVVYHLCGGHMPLLETVVENGTDCLETMTPPSMGADCNLAEANRRVGDKIAFIGGFDQNAGFEHGTPEIVDTIVHNLFEACPNGGYICSPSDHFFFGDPENLRAFVKACRECKY